MMAGREGGGGSWESLIATLRDCELSLLADQIHMALTNQDLDALYFHVDNVLCFCKLFF